MMQFPIAALRLGDDAIALPMLSATGTYTPVRVSVDFEANRSA
jgi:hypothetical protein